jgi:hypothetical protein
MSIESTLKKTKFRINLNNNLESEKYRILAIMLSSVPIGTRFNSRTDNLSSKLCQVMQGEDNLIILNNFRFNKNYRTSEDIDLLLSAYLNYGSLIGLENIGSDFSYLVSEKTHEIAHEIEDLGFIDKRNISYLKDLGKRLLNEK